MFIIRGGGRGGVLVLGRRDYVYLYIYTHIITYVVLYTYIQTLQLKLPHVHGSIIYSIEMPQLDRRLYETGNTVGTIEGYNVGIAMS